MDFQSLLSALRDGDGASTSEFLHRHVEALTATFPPELCPDALGRGRGGNRALAIATFFGHANALDMLLEAGAGSDGVMPIELARERLRQQELRGVRPGDRGWRNFVGVIEILEGTQSSGQK